MKFREDMLMAPPGKTGVLGASKKGVPVQNPVKNEVKAKLVYISGFKGQHSLELGMAYWFRGHHLYTAKGNPVEPSAFPTKKGIRLTGVTAQSAPRYDQQAHDLVSEREVAALHKSMLTKDCNDMRISQVRNSIEISTLMSARARASKGIDSDGAFNEQMFQIESLTEILRTMDAPVTVESQDDLSAPYTFGSTSMASQTSGHAPSTSRSPKHPEIREYCINDDDRASPTPSIYSYDHGALNVYYPHDRAQFLAISAPGSRLVSRAATPFEPRPATPHHGIGHGIGTRTVLRSTTSSSRPNQLLAEEDSSSGLLNPWQNAVRPSSSASSHDSRLSASHTSHFYGTASRSSNESPGKSLCPIKLASSLEKYENSRWACSDALENASNDTQTSPYYSRNKPIGTGRLRKASVALNKSWNATNPSVLPGLGAPGFTTPYSTGYTDHTLNGKQENKENINTREVGEGIRSPAHGSITKCTLHGEGCTEEVSGTYLTQAARQNRGFRDLYPILVDESNRKMIDWHVLLLQEKEELGIFFAGDI